jgi:outer membrane protein assembly factor BamB
VVNVRRLIVIVVLLFAGVAGVAGVARGQASVAELRKLSAERKHDAVVAAADRVIAALPPNARMLAWKVDFPVAVDRALIGSRHAYLLSHDSRMNPRRPQDALEVPDRRPVLRHDNQGYDVGQYVTCIDATTGRKLWTRRFAGFRTFLINPADDDLFAMAGKLFRLDASNGEVKLERDLGKEWREIQGIRVGGEVLTDEHEWITRRPDRLRVYDVDAGAGGAGGGGIVTGDLVEANNRPGQLSPNRLRALRRGVHQSPDDVTSTVAVTPPDTGAGRISDQPIWTYSTPGYSANDPVWLGNDVLVLSGMQDTRGAVARLSGESGTPRWVTVLPGGAYSLEHVYLPGNSHLEHTWDAVGELAGNVFAINGRGELFVLDPSTGEIRGGTRIARAHLAKPRVVEGAGGAKLVVLAGADALLAVPLDVLLGKAVDGEAGALLLKGRALLALGRDDDARSVAETLTGSAPDLPDGWRFRAEVAAKLKRPAEEAMFRAKAMELGGETRDENLRRSHGLLARIDSGPISAELAPVGPLVYAGTRDGALLKIDVTALKVAEAQLFPVDISYLTLKNNGLYRWGTNRKEELVFGFLNPPPPPPPYADPLYPLPDDNLRRLGGAGANRDSASDGTLGLWWGLGGVWAATPSGNRLPDQLIDVGEDRLNRRPYAVLHVDADDKTIGLVTWRSEQPALQIWSRDGKRKLREEPANLASVSNAYAQRARFFKLGDGYFFSGDELLWVPTDPAKPVWRFGLWQLPRRAMRHHDLRDYSFGIPRRVGADKIFVACREGGVFVFDVAGVTRGDDATR